METWVPMPGFCFRGITRSWFSQIFSTVVPSCGTIAACLIYALMPPLFDPLPCILAWAQLCWAQLLYITHPCNGTSFCLHQSRTRPCLCCSLSFGLGPFRSTFLSLLVGRRGHHAQHPLQYWQHVHKIGAFMRVAGKTPTQNVGKHCRKLDWNFRFLLSNQHFLHDHGHSAHITQHVSIGQTAYYTTLFQSHLSFSQGGQPVNSSITQQAQLQQSALTVNPP
jgi:hypothetical protein|eukprot:COSAG01_NODE_139_length_24311_cov_75.405873_8_plen_222_part_00